MTVLGTIIARVVVIVRAIALAELAVQVIIWRSFYLASPWLLAGPMAALAWGSTTVAYLRHRRPSPRFACVDTAVYTGLALCAAWCVPAAIRGEAGSWLFILVTTQAITPVWFAPRALSVPLAFVPGIAFAVGTALAPAAGLPAAGPRRASLALLFAVVTTHWLVRRALCGRAMRADAALAAADTEARDQYGSGRSTRRQTAQRPPKWTCTPEILSRPCRSRHDPISGVTAPAGEPAAASSLPGRGPPDGVPGLPGRSPFPRENARS